MASYTDSSAYDLSYFEEIPEREYRKPSSAKSRINAKNTSPSKKKTGSRTNSRASNRTGSRTSGSSSAAKKAGATERIKKNEVTENRPELSKNRARNINAYQHTVERNSTSAELSPAVKKICVFGTLCLALLFCSLFLDAKTDRVTSEISDTVSKIEIADGEKVRLNAELNSRISTERVESYAENVLGMVKAEGYQITYIDLSDSDKVIVSGNKNPDEKKSILKKAKELFAYIF